MSRLDYGKKYCADSITVDEQALQRAIVRALNRFNIEDESTYLMLMKSTIGEAIGINGSSDEIDLLERRIDALNKRMLDLVTLSVQEDSDAEDYEDEFKNISMQIEQLSGRITSSFSYWMESVRMDILAQKALKGAGRCSDHSTVRLGSGALPRLPRVWR